MKRPRPLMLAAALALAGPATALAQPASPVEAALHFLDREVAGLPGRIEVIVGDIDPRLTLAPCAKVEPFLPTGGRLWGKGFLGLKCTAGAAWRVTVPVEVRVHAIVPVAAKAMRAGQAVTAADTEEREIEVSAYPPGLVADLTVAEGRVLARALAAGQPLRAEHFKNPQAIAPGDLVRVIVTGRGFDITLAGKALNPAAIGENLKVVLGSGRQIAGILKAGRIVEVNL